MAPQNPRDMRDYMRTLERLTVQQRAMPALVSNAIKDVKEGVKTEKDRRPAPPIELVPQSAFYLDSVISRQRVRFSLDFPDVIFNTDGSKAQIQQYELWGREEPEEEPDAGAEEKPWQLQYTSVESFFRVDGYVPGTLWRFRARALGLDAVQPGEWSDEIVVRMVKDNVPPPQASTPVVDVTRGVLTVTWNGRSVSGEMPSDFDYAILAHDTTATPTREITRFGREGGFQIIADLKYRQMQYFRVRAVDESGNLGPWSAVASGFTTPLVDEDVILSEIDAGKTRIVNAQKIMLETGTELGEKLQEADTALAETEERLTGPGGLTDRLVGAEGKLKDVGALTLADGTTLNKKLSDNATAITNTQTSLTGPGGLTSRISSAEGKLADVGALTYATGQTLRQKLTASDTAITTAQGQLTTLKDTTVPKLNTDLTAATGRLTAAEGKITTAQSELTVAKADITVAKKSITDNAAIMNGAVTRLTTAEGEITGAKGRLTTAEGKLTTLANTTLPALNVQLGAAQGRLDSAEDLLDLIPGDIESAKAAAINAAMADAAAKDAAALAAAALDAKTKADAAQKAATDAAAADATKKAADAQAAAATDAKTKADKALADAKSDATAKANAAQAAAITAAAADATSKSEAAEAAAAIEAARLAQESADAAEAAALEAAKAYADAQADGAGGLALEAAKADATAKANAAQAAAIAAAALDATAKKEEAERIAALDAKTKADKALADAKVDAQTKATAAQTAATNAASADATKKTTDALVTAATDAKTKADAALAAAKTDATTKADKALADAKTDATSKATAAQAAAIAAADLAAKADATSKVAAAEARAATDAKTKADKALADAKTDATTKANAAQTAAVTAAAADAKSQAEAAEARAATTAAAAAKVLADKAQADALAAAKTYADAQADGAGGLALEAAKADATAKANAAKQAAIDAAALDATAKKEDAERVAALDAKTKADKALADAKVDAQTKATAAQTAATNAASADATKKTADALVAAATDAKTKADAALAAAKTDATTKADKALADAKVDAQAKATAAQTAAIAAADLAAKADATSKVAAAEVRAAADAKAKADKALADAKSDATSKAAAAQAAAIEAAAADATSKSEAAEAAAATEAARLAKSSADAAQAAALAAAKTYADAQASGAGVLALEEARADATAKANAAQAAAISAAALDATAKKEDAERIAALDAKAKADAALAAAKTDAQTKATAAQTAATNAASADATKKAADAQAAAATDAKNKADAALVAAKNDATSKADSALAYALGSAPRGNNVVVNGSFDQDFTGWTKEVTQDATNYGIDTTVSRTGGRSLRTTGKGGFQQSGVPVVAGQTWEMALWYKTDELYSNSNAGGLRLQATVNGAWIDAASSTLRVSADWTRSFVRYVVPVGVTQIRPRFAFNYSGGGKCWVDDVELVNITAELAASADAQAKADAALATAQAANAATNKQLTQLSANAGNMAPYGDLESLSGTYFPLNAAAARSGERAYTHRVTTSAGEARLADIPVTAGNWYQVSYWMKADRDISVDAGMPLMWVKSDGTVSNDGTQWGNGHKAASRGPLSPEWKLVSFTIQAPVNTVKMRPRFYTWNVAAGHADLGATVYMDDLAIKDITEYKLSLAAVDAARLEAFAAADRASEEARAAAGLANTMGRTWFQPMEPPAGNVHNWVGSVGNSVSELSRDGVVLRRNSCPNPRFQNNLNGWTGGSASWKVAFARKAELTAAQSEYLQSDTAGELTWEVAGVNGTYVSYPFATPTTGPTPVRYELRAIGVEGEASIRMLVEIYDTNNVRVSGSPFGLDGTIVKILPGEGHLFTIEGTVPAGIARAVFTFYRVNGATQPAGKILFSNVLIEVGTTGEYFDGDTPDDREMDLWIDTDEGNTPKRWNGVGWTAVTDQKAINAAIAAAAADATTKATAAQQAAITAASADATKKAADAQVAAAADAKAKADAALVAAKEDASTKAKAAENAAIAAAAADATSKSEEAEANAAVEAARVAKASADTAQAAALAAAKTYADAQADGAQGAALEAAKADATAKADAAKAAAIAAAALDATAKKEDAERVAALDAKAKADKALADAKVDAQTKATAAQNAATTAAAADATKKAADAQAAAATDAQTKATKALNDAKADATTKADAALAAAKTDATSKANAAQAAAVAAADTAAKASAKAAAETVEARVALAAAADATKKAADAQTAALAAAKTYADAQADGAGELALEAAKADATAKANAAQAAAITAAALDATAKQEEAEANAAVDAEAKANAALAAAKVDAKAKADAALADAKTDATSKAEAARAAAVTTAANDAQTKANTAKQAAIDSAATTAQSKVDTAKAATLTAAAADAKTKADEAQRLATVAAAAETLLKANGAKADAITAAAADAKTKADTAQRLATEAAATDASAKASKALADATTAAASLATEKANAAQAAAIAASALDASFKADEAEARAKAVATTAQTAADKAIADALAAAGLAGTKGKTLFRSTPPDAADRNAQTLWIDTTGGANTPKQWTSGTTWVAITDKVATDAARVAAQAVIDAGVAAGAAQTAQSAADSAMSAAGSKTTILTGTANPSGVAAVGTLWRKEDAQHNIIGEWRYVGGATPWQAQLVGTEMISNLDVGKLTAGTAIMQNAVAQKIAAATATFQKADIGNLTVTGDSLLNTVVAQKIGAGVGEFISLTTDQLVAGSANLGTAVAQKIAAATASFQKADISNLTAGTANMTQAVIDKLVANTAAFQTVTVDHITATATANLNSVVAQRIAAGTASFQTVDAKNLFVTGTSSLGDAVAKRLAAETGEFISLSVDQLTVTGTGKFKEAVANKMFVDIFAANKISTNHMLIGNFSNLLENGSFEYGQLGWGSAPYYTFEPAGGRQVPGALKFTGTTERSFGPTSNINIPVDTGDTYRLSGWVKTTGASGAQAEICWYWYAADGTFLGNNNLTARDLKSTDGWFYLTGQKEPPANASFLRIRPVGTVAKSTDQLFFDDISVALAVDASLLVDGAVTAKSIKASEEISAKIGQFLTLGVDQLTVSGTANMATVVADRMFSNLFSTRKLTANQIYVGEGGNLFPADMMDSGWDTSADLITQYPDGGRDGGSSMVIEASANQVGTYFGLAVKDRFRAPRLIAGQKYRISAFVRGAAAVPVNGARLYMRLFKLNSTSTAGYTWASPSSIANSEAFAASAWGKIEGFFTVPEGTDVVAVVGIYSEKATNTNVRFSDIVIQEAITPELIVDGAVTARTITASEEMGAKIGKFIKLEVTDLVATGTTKINSAVITKLFTETFATNKLTAGQVLIGMPGNLMPDVGHNEPAMLAARNAASTMTVTISNTDDYVLTPHATSTTYFRPLGVPQTPAAVKDWIPVKPGQVWRWGLKVVTMRAAGSIGFVGRTIDGTAYANTPVPRTVVNVGDGSYVYESEIPEGCAWIIPELIFPPGTANTWIDKGSMFMYQVIDNALIVDGAITTKKLTVTAEMTAELLKAKKIEATEIDVNSLNADVGWIGVLRGGILVNNAIETKHIKTNTITTDKLEALAITSKHTLTGPLIRTAASGARTEMTNQGIRVVNAANAELVKIGYGISTGMSVRHPATGVMTPLAESVFGASYIGPIQVKRETLMKTGNNTPARSLHKDSNNAFFVFPTSSATGILTFTPKATVYPTANFVGGIRGFCSVRLLAADNSGVYSVGEEEFTVSNHPDVSSRSQCMVWNFQGIVPGKQYQLEINAGLMEQFLPDSYNNQLLLNNFSMIITPR